MFDEIDGGKSNSSNPTIFDGNSNNGNTTDGGYIPNVLIPRINDSEPNIYSHTKFDGNNTTSGALDGGTVPNVNWNMLNGGTPNYPIPTVFDGGNFAIPNPGTLDGGVVPG
jgi:hypothetical protein